AGLKNARSPGTADELLHFMEVLRDYRQEPSGETQGNLFGDDDSVIVEAEKIGKTVSKIIKGLKHRADLAQKYIKDPKEGNKTGLEGDLEEIKAERERIKGLLDDWARWTINPTLVNEARARAGLSPESAPKSKLQQLAKKARAEANAELDSFGKMLKGKGLASNPMLDPEVIAGAAKLTAKYVKAGVLTFAEFTDRIAKKIGKPGVDNLMPVLRSEWEKYRKTGEVKGMEPLAKTTGPETTGTKNVKTDEMRQVTGMPERVKPDRESVEDWQAQAAARIKADPLYPGRLVAELEDKPRAINNLEEAVLGQHLRDLENRRKAGEDVRDEMRAAVRASELVGTEWGRAGVSRQTELAADFSVEGIVRQHLHSVNEQPTDEQMSKYEEMADKIKKLENENATLQEKAIRDELDKRIDDVKDKPKQEPKKKAKKGTKKERLQRKANAAVAKFKNAWSTLFQTGAVYDPKQEADKWAKIIEAASEVVRAYAEIGINTYLEFMAKVKSDFGKITDDQAQAFEEAWKGAGIESPLGADAQASEIGALAKMLMRAAVESGIEGREAVTDSVVKEFEGMGISITRSQAQQAMSGYGEFTELSKDEVSVKVRQYRGEMQQLLKLEDMQAGQAPQKTGMQRREPSKEERRLIKQVNEAKKRGGYTVTDPAQQLKSALTTAKTAIRHRIEELTDAIDSRKEIVKDHTQLKADAELNALRKQRDSLLEDYKNAFPVTREQIILTAKQQEKAAIRQIEKLERQLKEIKEGKPQEKAGQPSLVSKEIQAKLKRMRDRVKAAKKAAKDAEFNVWESEGGSIKSKGKSRPSDAQRLKTLEKLLSREISKLTGDAKVGRLESSRTSPSPVTSPAVESMRATIKMLKEAREDARKANPEYQAKEEAKRTARYKKNLDRQMAFWTQRKQDAVRGILPEKRKSTTPESDEIRERQYQIELVRREARAEIEEAERASRGRIGKALGFGGDLLDLPRSLMATGELSAVLRQGAFYTFGHPRKASRATWDSIRAAFSRRIDLALHDDLLKRPNHIDYVRGKLDTTASDGPLSHREEVIRSRIASKLTQTEGWLWAPPRWAAEGVLGAERAFRSFLNTMRADLFDYMKNSVEASRPGTWSESDAKVIANAANIFSGRGHLSHSVGWGRVFFAPRWVWSTVKVATGVPAWKGDSATRKAVAKVYVRATLGMAAAHILRNAILSLMAGDDDEHEPRVELDPRSSDFMKTRIGETRIDSGRGIGQLVTLTARVAKGETKRSTGEIVSIRGEDVPYGAGDTREVIHRFIDTKLAPLPSAVFDYMAGTNVVGEKATVGKIVGERLLPMTWRDIWDAEKELNVPQGTVVAIEAFLGTGLGTYGPRKKYIEGSVKEQQKQFENYLKRMEWDDKNPAYFNMLGKHEKQRVDERRADVQQNLVYNAVDPKYTWTKKDTDNTYQNKIIKWHGRRQELKAMIDAKGLTFSASMKLLVEHYRRDGSERDRSRKTNLPKYGNKKKSYMERAWRLAEFYGESNPEKAVLTFLKSEQYKRMKK
ncbi:MAG: hypothetical protein U9Q07_01045, partial [Planctomycetota bacterium]|nr:hypothetical protein [Planctomycetota bacterium]